MALAPAGKSFEAAERLEDGVRIVEVKGELDLASVKKVRDLVEPATQEGLGLVLDLSACSFIDSTGLRFVLETHQALTSKGCNRNAMVVVASPEVERMLTVTAIDLTVPVFASLSEAKDQLALGTHSV